MDDNLTALTFVKMVLIFTGITLFLFVGEPDIHDSVIEILRSWAK